MNTDLQPLLAEVVDYVKKNQGKQGYILTDDGTGRLDTIWATVYDDGPDPTSLTEFPIHAIRVVRDKCLEFLCAGLEFVNSPSYWVSINSYDVQFPATLFSIAESIEQYKTED